MFLPRSYFVYRSVFLLIVYITIILLKQVLLSKKYILFLDVMHLNFNFQAVSIFLHGAKANLPLYESDSLKWSHNNDLLS